MYLTRLVHLTLLIYLTFTAFLVQASLDQSKPS